MQALIDIAPQRPSVLLDATSARHAPLPARTARSSGQPSSICPLIVILVISRAWTEHRIFCYLPVALDMTVYVCHYSVF